MSGKDSKRAPTGESSEEIPPPSPGGSSTKRGDARTPPSVAPAKPKRASSKTPVLTPPPQLDLPLTDFGNAERLVAWHGIDLRFCQSMGWLVWDGRRWLRDETGEVMRRAKRTARTMLRQAAEISDSKEAEVLAAHALGSENRSRLEAMVKLAESEPTIVITTSQLDSDPWLLNLQNGTIDLRTGELREHQREDLLTKLAPVPYVPDAKCPRWDQFLVEVQPDESTRAYLKRLCGYAATAVVRDHVLPIHYGKGRNGKGVFTNTLQFILGDYATTVPTELLMAKQVDAHPTERTTLFGCRLAIASETEQNRMLATAIVKQLTGGDPISARYMRRDFFVFLPTHKLMLATNNRPVIRETKDAIWDRVHLIPWVARFVGKSQDKSLGEKLQAEASGILRWLVEGCSEWQRDGLDPPTAVVAATAQYRVDMDAIGDFIAERCVLEVDARISRAAMRNAYEAWCVEVGERFPQGAKAFAEQLREREIVEVPSMRVPGQKTPTRGWQGVRLRTPADADVVTYPPVDGSSGIAPTGARVERNPEEVSTRDYVTTAGADAPSVEPAPAAGDREVLDL